ncbi:MAG: acyl dehydratase, partial [Actinomyces sp.]
PFFDDLTPGRELDPAPALTVDAGVAATYQSIVGDQAPLPRSRPLAEAVTGRPGALVDPGLVLQIAIGQSTVATRRVIANLFYRGVRLHQPVRHGTTLHTRVVIGPMREASRRPDRPRRGLVVLSITTRDETGATVAALERCALLPFRHPDRPDTGHHDDVGTPDATVDLRHWIDHAPSTWDLAPLGTARPWAVGETRHDPLRDTVTGATELARLTLNQAAAHRDPGRGLGGRRLVYGGHTIALAQASLSRLLPTMATLVGWVGCDHTGPVFEGDVVATSATLDAVHPAHGGRLLAFTVGAEAATPGDPAGPRPVLTWRPVVFAP